MQIYCGLGHCFTVDLHSHCISVFRVLIFQLSHLENNCFKKSIFNSLTDSLTDSTMSKLLKDSRCACIFKL